MMWFIEISAKKGFTDPAGSSVAADIADLGIQSVRSVRTSKLYAVEGELSERDASRIARELLADPVTEEAAVTSSPGAVAEPAVTVVDVRKRPGVMDPVRETALRGVADLGLEASHVETGRRYYLRGEPSKREVQLIIKKILANEVIERATVGGEATWQREEEPRYALRLIHIPLLDADDRGLMEISTKGSLSLSLEEMRAIQKQYRQLGRDPTDAELETLAQTWSEHCVHKTFKGIFEYEGRTIDNLLENTIMKVTRELDKPWCVSVFEDNSGIIRFDDEYNVCFKVETHNHPSAIEPYGGAGTGIGGVIRDPMGTGLGAKPILNTDVFCFGPPDLPHSRLPKGSLHPKRVFKGVVAGVRDYGNRMGIPTANGAIFFDERYVANPLVYCGTVGLIPSDKCRKEVLPGDLVVVTGGLTGRDGIHGVTFASAQLTEESEQISSGAVQIGDAITEKKLLDVLLEARDENLFRAITDCGGGGLSSAIGEMGKNVGAAVDLEKVPLKYQGLSYTEIWISEAQERMLLAVPPEKMERLKQIFSAEDVMATVIGSFTGDRKLTLRYEGNIVCELDMNFLHHGYPRVRQKATWKKPANREPRIPPKHDYGADLRNVLGSWNICSKEWVIRQYDHEVQGGTILKPLQGAANDGPGDGCIVVPRLGTVRGLITSNGMNPRYGEIDPYHMAASAVDEALRQIIAMGGNLDQVALLDNFCWGNATDPQQLGALVRAALACYDTAKAYETPFISGKDSLNNDFVSRGKRVSIPYSLLISAIAVMRDVRKAVSMDAKEEGNLLYAVGLTKDELGGSQYYALHQAIGNKVPVVDPALGKSVMKALSRATDSGLVRACHDCSDGGLAVAIAETCFAGELGATIELAQVPTEADIDRDDTVLFSESNSRFIAEVRPGDRQAFEACLQGIPFGMLGTLTREPLLRISGRNGIKIVEESIDKLRDAWQAPLKW